MEGCCLRSKFYRSGLVDSPYFQPSLCGKPRFAHGMYPRAPNIPILSILRGNLQLKCRRPRPNPSCAADIARACAVEMHMDVSQEENWSHFMWSEHLNQTPALTPTARTPQLGHEPPKLATTRLKAQGFFCPRHSATPGVP